MIELIKSPPSVNLSKMFHHQTLRLPVVFQIIPGTQTETVCQVLCHRRQLLLTHGTGVHCDNFTEGEVGDVLNDFELRGV